MIIDPLLTENEVVTIRHYRRLPLNRVKNSREKPVMATSLT